MGGHSAWKKRIANGELAKKSGGAICRHRPRWGRKGKDLKLNRKGNIGGKGNPKKNKKKQQHQQQAKSSKSSSFSEKSLLVSNSKQHPKQIILDELTSWNNSITIIITIVGFTFLMILIGGTFFGHHGYMTIFD